VSFGVVLSIVLLFVISLTNDFIFGGLALHEAIPHFNYDVNRRFSQTLNGEAYEEINVWPIFSRPTRARRENAHVVNSNPDVVGISAVTFEPKTEYQNVEAARMFAPRQLTMDTSAFTDLNSLRTRMYTVNPCTAMSYADFNVERFMSKSMTIDSDAAQRGEPIVLIFHTHSTEMFVDSNPGDKFTGIVGVGAYLTQVLNEMGIPTMHMTNRWDIVNGQSMIRGAYERQEADIRRVLEQYPSIEIIIDLHRDGLPPGAPKLLTYIDGRPTAQIMFFNGLSQLNVNGALTPITGLPNPNLPYNLAFSFQMQLAANEMHPGFTRRIFLRAYRFSLHFLPRSLLVEVGAQNNTFEEAINAMRPLAEVLANIILD